MGGIVSYCQRIEGVGGGKGYDYLLLKIEKMEN